MAEVNHISVKELTEKILNHEKLFILDVRNTGEFDDWKVEGENVEIHNQPYFDLMDGVEPVEEKLPKEEPIYVICAKGGSSQMVAEQIAEAGYDNVYSIEGGMKAYSEHLEPIKVGEVSDGEIYQFVRIGKGCLSYLIVSNGEGAIVDSNRMSTPYEQFVSKHQVDVKYVIDTHLHADHISGGKNLAEKLGADYYLPPKDAEGITFEFNDIQEDDELNVGSTKIKSFYSPGHTIGSTSYIVDDQYLLTGDILFIESIGRPDLAGKAEDWVSDLRETLYERYKKLSHDLIVLPAHYMSVDEMNDDGTVSENLGELYKENHGLNIEDEQEFRHAVTDNLPPQPNSYDEIRQTNLGKMDPEDEKRREMEIGPNRCAIK
ncbi:MBL fold metallo-hydrolase [Aquisalibacillus elongatus]|uniref:Glyoxylase-like metal-dependent hydrolase (Beta-lactamase superfamily II) n=1 Tax=Aquisalibacillus elongatus TaxID=485577 RepID=A0A3N5BYB5_9BACI|nr:MBL fold metallo-hydrolase [Aquisalibacillus elongatus]RPF52162.1 glyoxylase-like metal-dependent hydrolase (beta-lactamase superfamily II) [Aquisalibacillus elongatus]